MNLLGIGVRATPRLPQRDLISLVPFLPRPAASKASVALVLSSVLQSDFAISNGGL